MAPSWFGPSTGKSPPRLSLSLVFYRLNSSYASSKGGKVWGSETTNLENWKATRRLVGHQSGEALSLFTLRRRTADPLTV